MKRLRENAGYKQAKDFAKAAGIPYSSYATYERGSWPNEANLTMIASTLHVSIDELMGYTPSPLSTIQQIKQDFANVGFDDETFYLVVFDPPHLLRAGKSSWLAKKYGILKDNWQDEIQKGFIECMRVLKKNGTLVFKWSEQQVSVSDILKAINVKPLFGTRRGKTIFLVFMK